MKNKYTKQAWLIITAACILSLAGCNEGPVEVNNYYITNSDVNTQTTAPTETQSDTNNTIAVQSSVNNVESSSSINTTSIEESIYESIDESLIVGTKYSVTGTKNYLALRNAPVYDGANEIAKLQNYDEVFIKSQTVYGDKGEYCYVTVISGNARGKEGYVNKTYLQRGASTSPFKTEDTTKPSTSGSYEFYTVTGTNNYLGVRSAPIYDESNIICKLYNGDQIRVYSTETYGDKGEYWYVSVPNSGAQGYVNKKYLVLSDSSNAATQNNEQSSQDLSYTAYTVTGTSNYLAIRSDPVYDESNVVVKLNNGSQVYVYSTETYGDKGEYWFVMDPDSGISGYANKKYLK